MADGSGRDRLEFESTAVGRRIVLCRQLAGMERATAGASVKPRLRPRAHALLRLLLPTELGGQRPTDALYSRTERARLFAEAIESASKGGDASKARAGLLLEDLYKMAGNAAAPGSGREDRAGDMLDIPSDFLKVEPGVPGEDAHALPVLNEAKVLGALPQGLQAAAAKAVEDHNPFGRIGNEELSALHPGKWAQFEEAQVRVRLAKAAYVQWTGDSAGKDRLREHWNAIVDVVYALRDELGELGHAELRRRRLATAEAVTEFAAEFMDASDVDPEQAEAWCSRHVTITKAAKARLKKLGYPPEQVLRDAAEFYRLARGRIEKVVIDSKGDRRANAVGTMDHGTAGRVNLGTGFDKRVLWHELGHHVEADPVAAAAARLFIRLRSKDDGKLHKLSKLTGHKGYGSHEVAYSNGFFHPYVGKVYSWGTTEVFSMGLESFSDPFLLAQRIAKDPETFEFVTGYLRSPKTALQRLHLAMRQSLREGNESAEAEAEDTAKASLAREVGKITDFVTATELPEEVDEWARRMLQGQVVGYLSPDKDGVYYVLAKGRWRHPKTRRMGVVFQLYKVYRDAQSLPRAYDAFPLNEPEIARLALASWRQTGIEPRYEYLASGQFILEE